MQTFPNRKTERAIVYFLLLQIVAISWLYSGTSVEFLFPMFALSIGGYVCYAKAQTTTYPPLDNTLNFVLFLLLAITIVQFLNPSYQLIVAERYTFLKKLDSIAWLPSSVKTEYYDGNVISALLAISSTLCVFITSLFIFNFPKITKLFIFWFVLNATAMGIVGCVQKYLKIPIIYNSYYSTSDFFGSFPLSNAAGAFLNLAVAASLSIVAFKTKSRKKKLINVLLGTICSIILSFSVCKSGSNMAILLNVAFWIITLLYIVYKTTLATCNKTVCIYIVPVLIGIIGVAAFLVPVKVGTIQITDEINKALKERSINESVNSRLNYYKISYSLIKQQAIFGYGGNSCKYLLSSELQKNRNKTKTTQPVSVQHAHSDIIEYVVEYGAIGLVAILSILASWFYTLTKNRINTPQFFLFLGVVLCLSHSIVDMHLHIPSTMIALAIMMAATVSPKNEEI